MRPAQADAVNNLPEPLPLVLTEAIRARVLGRRACAVLSEAEIVATGSASGIRREALALVDSTVTIDAGLDAQVVAGDVALAGRRMFGKVIEVGPHTCVVRRADQASYRDVVQLVKLVDGKPRFGPTGMLEGAGRAQMPRPAWSPPASRSRRAIWSLPPASKGWPRSRCCMAQSRVANDRAARRTGTSGSTWPTSASSRATWSYCVRR